MNPRHADYDSAALFLKSPIFSAPWLGLTKLLSQYGHKRAQKWEPSERETVNIKHKYGVRA